MNLIFAIIKFDLQPAGDWHTLIFTYHNAFMARTESPLLSIIWSAIRQKNTVTDKLQLYGTLVSSFDSKLVWYAMMLVKRTSASVLPTTVSDGYGSYFRPG